MIMKQAINGSGAGLWTPFAANTMPWYFLQAGSRVQSWQSWLMTVVLSCRASVWPLGNRAAHDMSRGILQI